MEVIPAIDLRNGKCVRLYQGDYKQETVFSSDPVSTALKWQAAGAGRLHLVDLDGAARGAPHNLDSIRKITGAVSIPVQAGGGIRGLETVSKLLEVGVERAIVGTVVIEDFKLLREVCRTYGDKIVVGIDARDGLVATRGWTEQSSVDALDLAERAQEAGAKRIIYTDISRDGTLTAPDFAGVAAMAARVRIPVIAAGGISSISDLVRLAGTGVEGAIVGRAIYTGNVKLAEAIAAVR
ncbi:MAG: 1-(5-phosphoribosyl)-5-[(5-phosphoribosylamino)methylideneamino]imidazole-4-carboxamide isomerase [Dehalococcoidia bacterium]|nr:1-(5-phosphoribosyl)-5-[(5-phosphoribosylamino)methylideneamino]imidazole-4-carboxamide isomerase [Dehalococcoidia bacterium]